MPHSASRALAPTIFVTTRRLLIARNPNVTLRELMATIGHSSYVAALRYQHATAERNQAIADYLDDVIDAAQTCAEVRSRPPSSESGCAIGVPWSDSVETATEAHTTADLRLHSEAAGGIEPPYGALQAPA